MASLAQIKQAVDDRLSTLWSAIQTKENAYALSNGGKYWQGLVTHSVTPSEGASALPDVGTKVPTDQNDPYPLALRNSTMPMSIMIDVYDGSLGKGYQATVRVSALGKIYERTAQVGNEAWRAQGWHEIIDRETP